MIGIGNKNSNISDILDEEGNHLEHIFDSNESNDNDYDYQDR